MKYSLAPLLLLFAYSSFAQPFSIKRIESDSGKVIWEIVSPQKPEVVKKINSVIYRDWGYDPTSKDPFASMALEDAFGEEMSAGNNRALSFTLEASHTGCGLHITRTVYNFDARTGTPVGTNELFGAEGTTRLKKALHKSWKAALKKAAASSDTREYYLEQYKTCLASADESTEQDIQRIEITDTGINFWAGSCLEGTTYDFEADVSQGPHFYSFGQLLPMLTPYGYTMFADKSTGPVQNLLRGTIDGKYPISLTILPTTPGNGDGPVKGMIVYDRVGQPINIKGTRAGNQFVIHELDDSNQPLSNIDLTWDGSKLTGAFVNLRSKKQMPFMASPVDGK